MRDFTQLVVRAALRCGYEAFAIMDADSLERAVDDWQPHVVTLDLCMPGLDALEIIWRLKRTRFEGRLIVVSGQPEPIRIEAISLATANGFKEPVQMGKPVQLVQLRELLAVVRADLLAPALADHDDELVLGG